MAEIELGNRESIAHCRQLLTQLASQSSPAPITTLLLSGLLQELQHKVNSLKDPKSKYLPHPLSQQLLWSQIDKIQNDILSKRKEKEDMENNICLYQEELDDVEELLQVKRSIGEELEEEIGRLARRRRSKGKEESETLETVDTEEKDLMESVNTASSPYNDEVDF